MGTRTDALHAQVGAVGELLALPTDWQAELAEMLGEDDGVTTLANRRARLTAERRRLKEASVAGTSRKMRISTGARSAHPAGHGAIAVRGRHGADPAGG